jgi:LuxR family maltose regulon positive regulatory protein
LVASAKRLRVPPPKIEVPRVPPTVLARPRLVGALDCDGGEDGVRATLVCAPAGYGKTTLLAMHAQRLGRESRLVGWMSCDRHDSDVTQFWEAVLAALSPPSTVPRTQVRTGIPSAC